MDKDKKMNRMFIVATYAKVHRIHFEIALEIISKALLKYGGNRGKR